jgi:hypothetical protein
VANSVIRDLLNFLVQTYPDATDPEVKEAVEPIQPPVKMTKVKLVSGE